MQAIRAYSPAQPLILDAPLSASQLTAIESWYADFRNAERFIEGSLKIQSRQGPLVDFRLKNAQRRLIARVNARREVGLPIRFILDKTRRVGMSAVIAALIFHSTPFDEGQSALILAHEKKAARNLFSYYHRFEQNYRPFLGIGLPPVSGRSASQDSGSIRWENRSQIEIATAGNLDFSRSFDFRFLHLSEYAYYPNIRGLMTALIATVADDPNTMIFKESTANGYNDFHKDCELAMAGESDYEFFFAGCFEDEENFRSLETDHIDAVKFEQSLTDDEWSLIEKYHLVLEQIYWRRKKLADYAGDQKRFDQEYPHSWEVSFQASSNQRFDPKLFLWMPTDAPFKRGELRREEVNRKELLLFRPHQYGELTIWKSFARNGQYIAGVDTAKGVDANEGVGSADPDYCAVSVGERNTGEQVMELHTRLEPFPFAAYLFDLGQWCKQESGNWIYYVIEVEFNGGNGLAVCRELQRLGYPLSHIYFSQTLNKASQETKQEIGFVIRPNTRPLLISNHERCLIEKKVIIHSKKAISEHLTFVRRQVGGAVRYEAERNCHDDLCFAAMYMTWGFENAPVFELEKSLGLLDMPNKYGKLARETEQQRRERVARARMWNSIKGARRDYE